MIQAEYQKNLKKIKKHGGLRPGAGRKKIHDEPMKKKTFNLTDSELKMILEIAEKLGKTQRDTIALMARYCNNNLEELKNLG